jgi:hypothetical protein
MKRAIANLLEWGWFSVSSLLFPTKSPAEYRTLLDASYPVEMIDQNGNKTQKKLDISAFLDDKKNELHFSFSTENFNRINWSDEEKKIPYTERYTRIDNKNTKISLLCPEKVRFFLIEQESYKIAKVENGSQIILYHHLESSPFSLYTIARSQKISEKPSLKMGVFDTRPFAGIIEESPKEKEEDNSLAQKIGKYKLLQYPPINLDEQKVLETGRTCNLTFSMGNVPEGEVPIYLEADIGLETVVESEGKFCTKSFGRLERVLTGFHLHGERELNELGGVYSKPAIQGEKSEIFYKDSSKEVRLTNNTETDDYPSLSPNKKRVAFVSKLTSKEKVIEASLWVVNIDGAELKEACIIPDLIRVMRMVNLSYNKTYKWEDNKRIILYELEGYKGTRIIEDKLYKIDTFYTMYFDVDEKRADDVVRIYLNNKKIYEDSFIYGTWKEPIYDKLKELW